MPSEQVGAAYAKIGLDDSSLDSGLSSAKGKFSSAMGDMEGRAESAASKIGGALKTGLIAVGVAAAGIATGATKAYADYEQGLANVGKTVDGTKEQIDALGESLRSQAVATGISVTSLEDVASTLGALGVKYDDIATTTEMVAKGSKAFGMDAAEMATQVAKLATVYDVPIAGSEKLLSAINALGNTTAAREPQILSFTQAMGPLAAMYGETAERTAAFGATLISAGVDAEEGATSIRSALEYAMNGPDIKMDDATKAQITEGVNHIKEQYKQAGKSTEEATKAVNEYKAAQKQAWAEAQGGGNERMTNWARLLSTDVKTLNSMLEDDLYGTLSKSAAALGNIASETDRSKTAFDIWGSYGFKVMGTFSSQAGNFDQNWQTVVGDINAGSQSMGQEFGRQTNTIWGAFDRMTSGLNDLGISVGKVTSGPFKDVLDWFNQAQPSIKNFIETLVSGDISGAANKIGNTFKSIKWADIWKSGIDTFRTAWDGTKAIASNVIGYFKSINWSEIGQAAGAALASIPTAVLAAIESIDWGGAVQTIIGYYQGLYTFLEGIGKGIYDSIVAINWADIGQKIISAIQSAWKAIGDIKWADLGYQAGKALSDAIKNAITSLSDLGSKISGYISSFSWSSTGESLGQKIKNGLDAVTGWAERIQTGFLVGWDDTGTKIGEALKTALGKVIGWTTAIISRIKKEWQDWIDAGGPKKLGEDVATAISNGAIKLGQWIYEHIKSYFTPSNGASLRQAISSAIDFAKMAVTTASEFAKGFGSTILTVGKGTIGAAILDTIGNALDSAWGGIGQSLHDKAIQWRADAESILAPVMESNVDVDVAWNGTDPSSVDNKTYAARVNVTTYTNAEGGTISTPTVRGLSYVPGTSTLQIGTEKNGSFAGYESFDEFAKDMAKQGASVSYIRDMLLSIYSEQKSKSGAAYISSSDVNAQIETALESAQPYIDEYTAAHKEADDNTVDASEEAADNTTDASSEAKSDLTAGSSTAKTNLEDGAVDAAKTTTKASEQHAAKLITAADYANTALKLGAEVGGKFATDAGQYVATALDESSGKLTATIGLSASNIQSKSQTAADALKSAGDYDYKQTTNAANKTTTAATTFQSKIDQGAATAMAAISKAGDPASKLVIGAQYAANALVSAGQQILSMVSSRSSSYPWDNPYYSWYSYPYSYAEGTVTNGPEMAVIGEDGPSNPEYVIPTKKKRWDLLYQAMRSYGIRGMAEGGSAGDATTTPGADVVVSFGIPGLLDSAKTIKRTLSDLQNYFLTTWIQIRADAQVYWRAINAELSTVAQSIGTDLSVKAQSWRASLKTQMGNIAIDQGEAWASIVEQTKTALGEATVFIVENNNEIKRNLETGLSGITASMVSFKDAFKASWQDVISNTTSQVESVIAELQTVVDKMEELDSMVANPQVVVSTVYSGGGGGSDWLSGDGEYGGWTPCGTDTQGNWIDQTTISQGGKTYTYKNTSTSAAGWYDAAGRFWADPWAASGADIITPSRVNVGEKGPELILPTDLRQGFVNLLDLGLNAISGSPQPKILKLYLDKKQIAEIMFSEGMSQAKHKGLSLA